MKTSYQCEVADHIDDAGNQDKEKRRLAVTEPAEDGGQQVVGDDEENAASADADVGGNALGSTAAEQLALVSKTAKAIVDLIAEGNEVVIAHGNGPQVGMINLGLSTAAEAGAIKADMPFPERRFLEDS